MLDVKRLARMLALATSAATEAAAPRRVHRPRRFLRPATDYALQRQLPLVPADDGGDAMTTDVITPDLKTTLRRLKLGRLLDTLPERLALARQQKMPHQDFLLLVLSDEVARRDSRRRHAARRAGAPRSRRCSSNSGTRPPRSPTTARC